MINVATENRDEELKTFFTFIMESIFLPALKSEMEAK